MAKYIGRRIIYMFISLLVLSFVSFVIIQLPPGDFLGTLIENMRLRGMILDAETIIALEKRYGLDQPMMGQYFTWLWNLLQGDMGRSFQWNEEVTKLIGERLMLTFTLALGSLLLAYLMAVPIAIYSATHQYSFGDYAFTVYGFIGLATPNFLLALLLMFLALKYLGWSPGGLFSREFVLEPWSFAKVVDLLKHLPVPLLVLSTAGTAFLIRVLRSSLLDELGKQYVITARAKGLHERGILFKYPVRIAVNPIISNIGGLLPFLVSGEIIVSVVMNLQTIGPLLLLALTDQDMFLAGSIVMLLGALGMVGILISDLLLAAVDPRIRFSAASRA